MAWHHWSLASGMALAGCFLTPLPAIAQSITLDGTLGNNGPIPTFTTPTFSTVYDIRQNLGQTVGSNLFHSFGKFNLTATEAAFFRSTPEIRNIFSRVTGGSPSDINGLIATQSTAVNLFLINPSGILFGPNARLDIGSSTRGSFVATTLDAITFPNGTQFKAKTPNSGNSLLTIVGDPSGFLASQRRLEPISSTSEVLRVYPGQSLVLLGGEIALDRSLLTNVGGHFQIAALAGAGTVGLTTEGNQLTLNLLNNLSRANISLTNLTGLRVTGSGGGAIQLWGDRITLNGSIISSEASGSASRKDVVIDANQFMLVNASLVRMDTLGSANASNLVIRASEIELSGVSESGIPNRIQSWASGSTGNGGNLSIATKQLVIRDGGEISGVTFSRGRGGTLTVTAEDFIEVIGRSPNQTFPSFLGTQTQSLGNAGDVNLTTKRLALRDGAIVATDAARSSGNAGNINIAASESVQITGISTNQNFATGGQLGSITRTSGRGGNVTIQTQDLILRGQVALGADTVGFGQGGNVDISASRVSILNGAQITASTIGLGTSGSITIRATDVEVVGTDRGNQSLITTQAGGSRGSTPNGSLGNSPAGDISIWTERLSVRGGGRIRTSTFGGGQAGDLTIYASESIVLTGQGLAVEGLVSSGLSSDAQPNSTGSSGDLTINTSRLVLRSGAQIGVGTFGKGVGGTLTVNASELIDLSGFGVKGTPSGLFASTEGSGAAGDIKLTTKQLNVSNFARVNVSSDRTGAAGNLEVNAGSIFLDNRGRLTASTLSGNGGNILLNVQDLLLLRNQSFISTSAGTAQAGGGWGKYYHQCTERIHCWGEGGEQRHYGECVYGAGWAGGNYGAGDLWVAISSPVNPI
jgi:filamentous hemagglutinin family protein